MPELSNLHLLQGLRRRLARGRLPGLRSSAAEEVCRYSVEGATESRCCHRCSYAFCDEYEYEEKSIHFCIPGKHGSKVYNSMNSTL